MSEPISSPRNPVVRQLAALRESRARKKLGLTRIDGARELERALDAGLAVEDFVVCPARLRPEGKTVVARATEEGRPPLHLSDEIYDELRYGDRDEGLCVSVPWKAAELGELEPSSNALILIMEAVEKPGNLGAALRSADAVGADAVILCDPAIDPANPNAVRSSLGTLFTVPVALATVKPLRHWLRDHEISVAAALVDAKNDYTAFDFRRSTALVVGAEHQGLSEAWREDPAESLHIPMRGRADSLNVSVAAAVLLFEARRQRSICEQS